MRSKSDNACVVPQVTVITVCYNSARTIRRTMESVASQKYANIEYIVIDGGSTDATMSIVREYPRIVSKIVSEPDEGIYDAMNKGVRMATGEWIHILNSDDYYASPNALSAAVPMLDPERTNYFEMWREFDDGRRVLQDWDYSRWRLFVSAFLPHPALIVSRRQYEAAGLYDTRYRIAADHDMILRLTARWPGMKHDMALSVMQQGGASALRLDESLREFRAVTERHGLPRPVGACLQGLKRIWWRI
jgi:glycosyltransferase involved in cell wall biosynthesis